MKGISTMEAVGIILVTFLYIAIIVVILPKFFGDFFKEFSHQSAEVVARDLAGFITVSGAATDRIKIDYVPSQTVKYDVKIENRFVDVWMLGATLKDETIDPSTGEQREVRVLKELGSSKTAVDPTVLLENANQFVIEKVRSNLVNKYEVRAK